MSDLKLALRFTTDLREALRGFADFRRRLAKQQDALKRVREEAAQLLCEPRACYCGPLRNQWVKMVTTAAAMTAKPVSTNSPSGRVMRPVTPPTA